MSENMKANFSELAFFVFKGENRSLVFTRRSLFLSFKFLLADQQFKKHFEIGN